MNILLHSCCGPCSVAVFEDLRAKGHRFTSFFYNPNIHPFKEQQARHKAWQDLCLSQNVPMVENISYPLEDWLTAVAPNPKERCTYCYTSRLRETARLGKKQGFDVFTTTLQISPYQNQGLIAQIGREEGAKEGIEFLVYDFRPLFREGQNKAWAMGLYLQKYCGCIYSEKERYIKG